MLRRVSSCRATDSFQGASPAVRLAGLGISILQAVFEYHPSKRDQILDLTQLRLLGTTADAAMPFVRLLACLVRNKYGLLSDHLGQLRVSLLLRAIRGWPPTSRVDIERGLLAQPVL